MVSNNQSHNKRAQHLLHWMIFYISYFINTMIIIQLRFILQFLNSNKYLGQPNIWQVILSTASCNSPALLGNKVITNNDTTILNYRMQCIASSLQILIVPLFSRSVINYKNNCKVEQLFILQCLKVILWLFWFCVRCSCGEWLEYPSSFWVLSSKVNLRLFVIAQRISPHLGATSKYLFRD